MREGKVMTGFLLVVLMVLSVVGIMLFLWLAAVISRLQGLAVILAALCLCLGVVLFGHAFYVWPRSGHRPEFTILCWFTCITVVVLVVWYWLILEEFILPRRVRTNLNH